MLPRFGRNKNFFYLISTLGFTLNLNLLTEKSDFDFELLPDILAKNPTIPPTTFDGVKPKG